MAQAPTLSESDAPFRPMAGLASHLFVVFDCMAPALPPQRHALSATRQVHFGRGELREHSRAAAALHLRFPDKWMSSRHATLTLVAGHWLLEDLDSRNGTRVNAVRVSKAELQDGDLVEMGRTFMIFREERLAGPLDLVATGSTRTLLPELEAAYAQLGPLVRATVPVMISGETGVGKEQAARLVHQLSGRSGPFIPVNCGALPSELVASQLFGHQRGAFTGAAEAQAGFVRSADRGTLFLDEVGELPMLAQPALLRVLQEREVTPVGATRPVQVDLQLVTATNRDLQQMTDAGDFRADLLSRLSGYRLQLPPLRERREDLGLLVRALLGRLGAGTLTLSPEAARALFAAHWPMNVRELERALQVGAALCKGEVLEVHHLPPTVLGASPASEPRSAADEALRTQLLALLEAHQGNITSIAREMGKARMQVQRWLKRLGLEPERFR